MRHLACIGLLMATNATGATTCTTYAIGSFPQVYNTAGQADYIRIAAPPGARNLNLIRQARYAGSGAPSTWTTDGVLHTGFGPTEEFPTTAFLESGVSKAFVGRYTSSSSSATEFRMVLSYQWDQIYCRAMAWNRVESGRSTTFQIGVPIGSTYNLVGQLARDGDNGQPWHSCAASVHHTQDCDPPSHVAFDAPIPFVDQSGTVSAVRVLAYNGSPKVRNVIVYIDFTSPASALKRK
jgi:hypothetical protein